MRGRSPTPFLPRQSEVNPAQALEELRAFEQHGRRFCPSFATCCCRRLCPTRRSEQSSRGLPNRFRCPGWSGIFLYVIIDRRRADLLDEIADAFESALDERLGIVRADVKSAAPLERPPAVRFAAGAVARLGQAGPLRLLDRSGADRRRGRADRFHRLRRFGPHAACNRCASGWSPS